MIETKIKEISGQVTEARFANFAPPSYSAPHAAGRTSWRLTRQDVTFSAAFVFSPGAGRQGTQNHKPGRRG